MNGDTVLRKGRVGVCDGMSRLKERNFFFGKEFSGGNAFCIIGSGC